MSETIIVSWNDLPETVKNRLKNRWFVELANRYAEMGFGQPKGYEIERNVNHLIKNSAFLQSGHYYYECYPKKI